jgi:hypothetical protein
MPDAGSDTGTATGFVPGCDTLNKNSKPKQVVEVITFSIFFRVIYYQTNNCLNPL